MRVFYVLFYHKLLENYVKVNADQIIYLDNNSTTKTDDRVIDAMVPIMRELYANPSSSHLFGRKIQKLVDQARINISSLINCEESEIVFTSEVIFLLV